MEGLLEYQIAPGKVEAFSTFRDSVLPYPVVTGHQVHGTKIAVITAPDTSRDEFEGFDAFITNVKGCAIAVRTADCIPVLLFRDDGSQAELDEQHTVGAVLAHDKGLGHTFD